MLLVLALGAGVHDDTVTLVADAVLGATTRVHLEVGDVKAAVGHEVDFTEAERVALTVSVGVSSVDADDLVTVLDADVDAVLVEAALTVLDSRVAGQCHGGDVFVPGDGDLLEVTGSCADVTAVTDSSLRCGENFVAVGGADVDLVAVLVAHECLQIVILVLGLPAVGSDDRCARGLREADLATLFKADLAVARGGLSHRCSWSCRCVLLTEESHGNSFHSA
jgi:hypothetical protein